MPPPSRREFLRLSGLTFAGALLPPSRQENEEFLALLERSGEPLARGVFTRDRKKLRRVLMKTVQVSEGYPFSEVVTSPKIGMRLDDPNLMEHVAGSGAGSVRIFGPVEDVGVRGSVLENALSAAEAQGLSPLLAIL